MKESNKWTIDDCRRFNSIIEYIAEHYATPLPHCDSDMTYSLPWDCGIGVSDDGCVVMDGGAGPNGWGSCVVRIPINELEGSGIEIQYHTHSGIESSELIQLRIQTLLKLLPDAFNGDIH